MRFRIRAVIVIALTLATASCDRTATAPGVVVGRPAHRNEHAGNAFFSAWSWDVFGDYIARTSPLTTVPYNKLDPNGYREHWNLITQLGSTDSLISFADHNAGKRYILGDEANQDSSAYGSTEAYARQYARDYCDAVAEIHNNHDATATFGPGGFTDDVPGWWLYDFIDEYDNYASGKCHGIPIAEWTFHVWGTFTNLAEFENRVADKETWAANHGAPMALGLWRLDFSDSPDAGTYLYRLRQAKNWLASQSNIVVTRYASYYPYSTFIAHSASDAGGNLTAEGLVLGGYDTYATIQFGGTSGDDCLWWVDTNIPGATFRWFVDNNYIGTGSGWSTPYYTQGTLSVRVFNAADEEIAYRNLTGTCEY